MLKRAIHSINSMSKAIDTLLTDRANQLTGQKQRLICKNSAVFKLSVFISEY